MFKRSPLKIGQIPGMVIIWEYVICSWDLEPTSLVPSTLSFHISFQAILTYTLPPPTR